MTRSDSFKFDFDFDSRKTARVPSRWALKKTCRLLDSGMGTWEDGICVKVCGRSCGGALASCSLFSLSPGSQSTSRSPGVVPSHVVDMPLRGFSRGIVPHSRSPSSGNASCKRLPFRGGVSTTRSPSGGGASDYPCAYPLGEVPRICSCARPLGQRHIYVPSLRGFQCLELCGGGFFSLAC